MTWHQIPVDNAELNSSTFRLAKSSSDVHAYCSFKLIPHCLLVHILRPHTDLVYTSHSIHLAPSPKMNGTQSPERQGPLDDSNVLGVSR